MLCGLSWITIFLLDCWTLRTGLLDCSETSVGNYHYFFFIGTATLVGFGLLNYRWVFSAGRFLQSAVASGTSNPPNLEDQWLERSNSRHRCSPRLKRRERTPAAEGWTMVEKLQRILPKVATSTSLLGSFICRKFTTWDRRLYFPGNYHYSLRNNPEERSSHILGGRNLKSRTLSIFSSNIIRPNFKGICNLPLRPPPSFRTNCRS